MTKLKCPRLKGTKSESIFQEDNTDGIVVLTIFILTRFQFVATTEINFMKGELFMTNGLNEMVMPIAPMYGNDGYSRHNKDEMIEHLKEMMHNARSEEEKESYRRTIEQMQR